MIVTMTCDMGTIKGYDLNEDGARNESNKRVGFWSFMTMSEKTQWAKKSIHDKQHIFPKLLKLYF